MNRREMITLLGGAAAGWPLAARAEEAGGVRRVAALLGWSEGVPEYHEWVGAFVKGLAQAGWVDGRNLRIDVHWTNAEIGKARALAKEVADSRPDVILAGTT